MMQQRARGREPRIGVALAGGGPLGGMYELGALCALEEAIAGFDATAAHRYVGVSVGGLIAAGLAAGLCPHRLVRVMFGKDSELAPLDPSVYAKLAFRDWLRRGMHLPQLVARSLWRQVSSGGRSMSDVLLDLAPGLPVAAYDNAPIAQWVRDLLDTVDVDDNFGAFDGRLIVVATDLQSGEPALFGRGGLVDVPVSAALQASTAIPGVYPPVRAAGRRFVDGAVSRTMHASVVLEEGVDLLITLNPLVPVDGGASGASARDGADLERDGLPTLLSQSVRTLLHSRMRVAHARYSKRYPATDIIALEPRPDDREMFFVDPLAFEDRQAICVLGFETTRRTLRKRARSFDAVLARHGLCLRHERLAEGAASLWDSVGLRSPERGSSVIHKLDLALSRTEARLRAS